MFSILYALICAPSISLLDQAGGQTCQNAIQYDQCSSNTACGCLPLMNTDNDGICAFLHTRCSELISCVNNNRTCYRPGHLCVNHPRCQSAPLCYPANMALHVLCPPMLSTTTTPPPVVPDDGICASATWNQNGVTVAGGNGAGSALNQLAFPQGLFVDEDAAVYVADTSNDRLVKWMPGVSSGRVMAGGNGEGNQNNQLNHITKVVVDKNETMFICDSANKRVQRWFNNDTQGETIIANISCWGLAMDNEGSLYVSEYAKNQVTKWPGDHVVAGGNGQGSATNQLWEPIDIFVDRDQSVFVADFLNHRLMKWPVGAKEGILVAGGNESGDGVNQLNGPTSVVVDQMGTIYIVDSDNHRVMRWLKGSESGSVIIGGRGNGSAIAQLAFPQDLTFDRQGNLYVADYDNHRVQMFTIDKSSCTKVMNDNCAIG